MRKIAIVNNKGGVGKTTTVFNLAHYFAEQGLKVLAVDLDSQLNLTLNFGISEINYSLGDYLLERQSKFTPIVINEKLHFVSAGGEAEQDMIDIKSDSPFYYRKLDDFLEKIKKNYDIVIFDTAPAFNIFTISALYTANVYPVLIPGVNEFYGLNATVEFTRNLNKDISGIILIKKEVTKLSKQIQEELEKEYSEYLLKSIIRKNVALSESIFLNKSIFEYDLKSSGAKDYKNLGEEILRKEGIENV